jgi:hypothetical protein
LIELTEKYGGEIAQGIDFDSGFGFVGFDLFGLGQIYRGLRVMWTHWKL